MKIEVDQLGNIFKLRKSSIVEVKIWLMESKVDQFSDILEFRKKKYI